MLLFLIFPALGSHAGIPARPQGYVSDFANVLEVADRRDLEERAESMERNHSAEIAIVTVADLGGRDIEGYAVDLFKKWGIGKKGQDNGLLILVSVKDRAYKIEVGYGLEGILNDAKAGDLGRADLIPAFIVGQYGQGLRALMVDLDSLLAGEAPPPQRRGPGGIPRSWIKWIILLIILRIVLARYIDPWFPGGPWGRRRRYGYWSSGRGGFGSGWGGGGWGGGSGGGFGGFGGGSSGGGGAVGKW